MIIDKTRKVLVLKWSAKDEEFIYNMKNLVGLAEKLTLAKRDTYKISTIFHDPLGMITPIALQSKLFFTKYSIFESLIKSFPAKQENITLKYLWRFQYYISSKIQK